MNTDIYSNPSLLKLDLYCKGARVDDSCFVEDDGGRPILRTRAGLGSGLEVVLPSGYWTNIPVAESFAQKSPYLVRREQGRYLLDQGDRFVAELELSPRPDWYERRTQSTQRKMRQIGTLQGTYLGVYPGKVCEYWTYDNKENCKFCSVGLNLGHDDADDKNVEEVLEVVRHAMVESGVTYVDFNTGHYEGETYLDLLEPYIRAIKQETGLLIGVQTPPHHDLERYDALKKMGVNRVSFCFEIFDHDRFVEVCPGKDRLYGLDHYLRAVEYCAELGRRHPSTKEPWVSNGEIIAGLEDPQSSIEAIDWIAQRGAIPTVCVFRPLAGTDYQDQPAPRTEDLVPVFARLYEACMENGLPIGLAPNIHVSLVMLPEECAGLSQRRFPMQRARLWAMRKAFGYSFGKRWQRKRNELVARLKTSPSETVESAA